MNKYQLYPIGAIIHENDTRYVFVYDDYKRALLQIDKFSHIILFYIEPSGASLENGNHWGVESERVTGKVEPDSLTPIKLAVVRVLKADCQLGLLQIETNLSFQGTIIDIKPYFPIEDRVKDYLIPKSLSALPSFIPENTAAETSSAFCSQNPPTVVKDDTVTEIHSNGMIRKTGGRCLVELTEADERIFNYLGQFSHIQILWWFSRFEKTNFRKTTECNPPYENAPRTGVFASRSPVRPNPIGLSTARIIKSDAQKKIIEIAAIDAFDKTPVVDVKPYIPFSHRVAKCQTPSWVDHWSEWRIEPVSSTYKGKRISLRESDFLRLTGLAPADPIQTATKTHRESPKRTDNNGEDFILIVGAKENNLKNISLKIPKNKMTVITGLSGSGKSSLAFDTIYAESQRRFMDSISPTGRQFFKQLERPNVDQISNLPPAIAIEQKSVGRNIRSTVGTVSDIFDYLRLLYARIGLRHCPNCGRAVEAKTISEIMNLLNKLAENTEFIIVSLKNKAIKFAGAPSPKPVLRDFSAELKNVVEALLATESGAFKVEVSPDDSFILHTRNHCYYCGVSFFELTPAFFSNNNPESMCPECDGLGVKMTVSPELIVSAPEKSILDGASLWWGDLRKFIEKPTGNWMKGEVVALAQEMKVDLEKPWNELPEDFRNKALFGTDGACVNLKYQGSKGRSGDISRPVEGAVNHIQRLFRGSHGKGSTEFYLQFMEESQCPACYGEQLNAESRFVTVAEMRFPEIAALTVAALHDWACKLPAKLSEAQIQIFGEIVAAIINKTEALIDVGLPYLTLNRTMPTLSGGEAQRLRLATQLGCGLTNLLYILDEPTVGLHASDQKKLIDTLKGLRDSGNTLVIVEHDPATMLEADHLIDIGPGAGINGGYLVAQGTPEEVMANPLSITGKYLSRKLITGANLRRVKRKPDGFLTIKGACKNNLKEIDVSFPLGMFVCVTGKSGSGKSSLVTKTLSPILSYYYNHKVLLKGDFLAIEGLDRLANIITITQEAIGRSPRSNPATYTGVFDEIRNIFAATPGAKERNFTANRFSFNNKEGRCNSCEGEGRKKIEMNFMSDVWITCPDCGGKRFNKETLQVTYQNKTIATVLEMDINEASLFFEEHQRVSQILNTLKEVGLGYLKLGQSALTLSGGEAQRIKLAKELSDTKKGKTLYILDEPATGLHFSDIDHLLTLIHRIVDEGNSVIIIEHNTDIIKNADWVIELGPEGGEKGGYLVYEGMPKV